MAGVGVARRKAWPAVEKFLLKCSIIMDLSVVTDTGNEAVITGILIENSGGVFGGQVGKDNVYEGAHVYRFRVVPGGVLDDLCEIEGI